MTFFVDRRTHFTGTTEDKPKVVDMVAWAIAHATEDNRAARYLHSLQASRRTNEVA